MNYNQNGLRKYTFAEIKENGIKNYSDSDIRLINEISEIAQIFPINDSSSENRLAYGVSKKGDGLQIPAFLNSQLGRLIKVEFLFGERTDERVGTLVGVGENFILLKLPNEPSVLLCETSAIKFITVSNNVDV